MQVVGLFLATWCLTRVEGKVTTHWMKIRWFTAAQYLRVSNGGWIVNGAAEVPLWYKFASNVSVPTGGGGTDGINGFKTCSTQTPMTDSREVELGKGRKSGETGSGETICVHRNYDETDLTSIRRGGTNEGSTCPLFDLYLSYN